MGFAFVFPGQGSQSVGMKAELAAAYPQVRQTYEEASDVLGLDLWKVVQEGPEEHLNQTHITQPAMLAAGVAVWRVWQSQGGRAPMVMAGHSLGEYTALVCAGALEFRAAIGLVFDRGRYMQEAVPPGEGAMAAILGLDDDKVIAACAEAAASQVVSAVNFNSPHQVVIAGHASAVERAVALAKAAGAKRALLLPVSVPSHCALMRGAADKLRDRLGSIAIQRPGIAVINNVDVRTEEAPEAIRDALVRQLHSPVRWVETVHDIVRRGVHTVVECGPGKVLVGLNKRIEKGIESLPMFDPHGLAHALEATSR